MVRVKVVQCMDLPCIYGRCAVDSGTFFSPEQGSGLPTIRYPDRKLFMSESTSSNAWSRVKRLRSRSAAWVREGYGELANNRTSRRLRSGSVGNVGAQILFMAGAIFVGIAAVGFALASEQAIHLFENLQARWPFAPLFLTPAVFVGVLWLSRRYFEGGIAGSGIPQTIAAASAPARTDVSSWLNLRLAGGKIALTVLALGGGASIGREGPTVQIGASIMLHLSRYKVMQRFASRKSLIIAGGAAGIAAAFNTPLAGIVFAIEELSRGAAFRANGATLSAVIFAGLISLAVLGNYNYFGHTELALRWPSAVSYVVAAGLLGGLFGGLFARLMIESAKGLGGRLGRYARAYPYRFAAGCGLVVAVMGIVATPLVFGTGYAETRAAVTSNAELPMLSGLMKMLATWVSYISGLPGGVFAPSLAVGAGLGSDLAVFLPDAPRPALMLLVMSSYLAGFTQAPITAFIIVMEMSDNHELFTPLMASAVLGHAVSRLLCPTPMYDALAAIATRKIFSPAGLVAPGGAVQPAESSGALADTGADDIPCQGQLPLVDRKE